MAIQREIWVNYIVESLFANNGFLSFMMDWTEYIRDGKTVHVPQAGDASDVVLNNTVFPIAPSDRVDTELQFPLDTLYVKPVRVPVIDEYELSYNKRESLMGMNLKNLADVLARIVLYRIASNHGTLTDGATAMSPAKILRTTGAAIAATYFRKKGSLSASGTRNRLTKEDMVAAQLYFDGQDVPAEDRVAIIPAQMMAGLLLDSDLMKRDNALELDPKTGKVSKLYGFNIINRSSTVPYSNAGTPVALDIATVDAANQAAINAYNNAALFWQKNCVGKAQGETEPFEDERNPQYYGTLLSYLQKFGACKARLDALGVLAIVEAVPA